MNLDRNDDQRMLLESARKWLARNYDFESWRRRSTAAALPRDAWAQFAEMGWLAMGVPEAHGGLGSGAADMAVIAESFGEALVLEPYLSTVVLGAGLIERAGSASLAADFLPRIAGGELRAAFAHAEEGAGFDLARTALRAEKRQGGWQLHGRKIVVWDAPAADIVIVLARTAGAAGDAQGLGLFLVDTSASGLRMRGYPMIDRRPGAHIDFDGVAAVALLGDGGDALAVVGSVVDRALAFLSAEACGVMSQALERTVSYVRDRQQFGSALAGFQVIRHRLVDMHIHLESTRSLALHAAHCLQADSEAAHRAAAAAKVQAGRSGRHLCHEAIQLHGGMGMTDELIVGHCLKRLMLIETAFGNADHHLTRLAVQSAAVRPALASLPSMSSHSQP